MNTDRIILPLTPQTFIRSTSNEKVLFRIPETCPRECGLPRRSSKQPLVQIATMKEDYPEMWAAIGGQDWKPRKNRKEIRYGCPHSLSYESLNRKRSLERYNRYKAKLRELAAAIGFVMPQSGWSLYFYYPVPEYWSNKKKLRMHGQFKLTEPDVDNNTKAVMDALSATDETIAQLSGVGKFWVNQEAGYIEILLNQPVYNPFGVTFIDQSIIAPKRKWVKKDAPDLRTKENRREKKINTILA